MQLLVTILHFCDRNENCGYCHNKESACCTIQLVVHMPTTNNTNYFVHLFHAIIYKIQFLVIKTTNSLVRIKSTFDEHNIIINKCILYRITQGSEIFSQWLSI